MNACFELEFKVVGLLLRSFFLRLFALLYRFRVLRFLLRLLALANLVAMRATVDLALLDSCLQRVSKSRICAYLHLFEDLVERLNRALVAAFLLSKASHLKSALLNLLFPNVNT